MLKNIQWIFLGFAISLLVLVWIIIQLLRTQNQNAVNIDNRLQNLEYKTTVLYNIFSGFDNVESIDLLYDK